jgi:hypothetical protein
MPPSYFAWKDGGAALAVVVEPDLIGTSTGLGCAEIAAAHKNDATIRKYILFMEFPFLTN